MACLKSSWISSGIFLHDHIANTSDIVDINPPCAVVDQGLELLRYICSNC